MIEARKRGITWWAVRVLLSTVKKSESDLCSVRKLGRLKKAKYKTKIVHPFLWKCLKNL